MLLLNLQMIRILTTPLTHTTTLIYNDHNLLDRIMCGEKFPYSVHIQKSYSCWSLLLSDSLPVPGKIQAGGASHKGCTWFGVADFGTDFLTCTAWTSFLKLQTATTQSGSKFGLHWQPFLLVLQSDADYWQEKEGKKILYCFGSSKKCITIRVRVTQKLQGFFSQQLKKISPQQIKNPLHLESQIQDMKNFTLQSNCNPFSFSLVLIDQS